MESIDELIEVRECGESAPWFHIWLDVPLEAVLARVPADGRRPLASDRTQMGQLVASRQAVYELARMRIDTGLAPALDIAERIIDGMRDLGL